MASDTPPSSRADNASMGNTIINNGGGVVVAPQIFQNSTALSSATVHDVQVSSTSPPGVFSVNSDQKTNNATKLLSSPEHKSTGVSHASFSAANGPRTPPTVSQPNPSWDEQEEDDFMFDEHDESQAPAPLSDRIPTPFHPITTTRFSTPPIPPRERFPSEHPNGRTLRFSMDLRSPGCNFAMPISPVNNLGMLLKIIKKHCEITKTQFSTEHILPGLIKHNIKVSAISHEKQREKKAQLKYKQAAEIAAAAAGGPVSSPPSMSPVYVPSHHFSLKFNSTDSRDLALPKLIELGIKAYIPRPRIITGVVYGIPSHKQQDKEALTQHLTPHYFKGGASTLHLSCIEFDPVEGVTLTRDAMYFAISAHEYAYAQTIPSIGNPNRPLRFEIWEAGKKVCNFCWKFNHNGKICEKRKEHQHPACARCGSFQHITVNCTNTNAKCPLCHKAKHSARNCALFLGTYHKSGTKPSNPLPAVGKAIPPHLQARVGSKSYSAVTFPRLQNQPQPQQQQQEQPQEPQQVQDKLNNSNEEIKLLKDTITELKEMLQQQVSENKTLMQQNKTLMEQMLAQQKTMMQLVAKALNMQITEDKNNDIDIQTHSQTQQSNTNVVPSPAMTATSSRSMIPPSPRTPGPRPKQVDLSSQLTIKESIRRTPTQTQTAQQPAQPTHDTDMTARQQAYSQLMDTPAQPQHATHTPKPTPTSARRLSQQPPPTPPRQLTNKRQRASASPQQS